MSVDVWWWLTVGAEVSGCAALLLVILLIVYLVRTLRDLGLLGGDRDDSDMPDGPDISAVVGKLGWKFGSRLIDEMAASRGGLMGALMSSGRDVAAEVAGTSPVAKQKKKRVRP